jgi:hypothetical protein
VPPRVDIASVLCVLLLTLLSPFEQHVGHRYKCTYDVGHRYKCTYDVGHRYKSSGSDQSSGGSQGGPAALPWQRGCGSALETLRQAAPPPVRYPPPPPRQSGCRLLSALETLERFNACVSLCLSPTGHWSIRELLLGASRCYPPAQQESVLVLSVLALSVQKCKY